MQLNFLFYQFYQNKHKPPEMKYENEFLYFLSKYLLKNQLESEWMRLKRTRGDLHKLLTHSRLCKDLRGGKVILFYFRSLAKSHKIKVVWVWMVERENFIS